MEAYGLRGEFLTSYWAVTVSRRKLCLRSSMFVLFCQFTFCLTKPVYCYYFMPCLVVFMGISHLAGLFVGPMDRILVTIVISCALCGFGNVCFVRSLCHMSVQPFLTIPLFGTCPMHSVL